MNQTPVNFLVVLKDAANYYSAFLLHINESPFLEFVEFMHPQKKKHISERFNSKLYSPLRQKVPYTLWIRGVGQRPSNLLGSLCSSLTPTLHFTRHGLEETLEKLHLTKQHVETLKECLNTPFCYDFKITVAMYIWWQPLQLKYRIL